MQIRCAPIRAFLCAGLTSIWLGACASAPEQPAACPDVATSGTLNLMTINLLFSEVEERDERLETIAGFVADNRIDVVLLQEVVSGTLVDTKSSARDLQDILADEHALSYDLRTAFEAGIPGLLLVGNATLSRCEILFRRVRHLPKASELEIRGRAFGLLRNVLMIRLALPDFGELSVYNTHLCARCPVTERDEQLAAALDFIGEVEDTLPGSDPVVFGGDFNIDIFRDDGVERPLYDRIIESGVIDTAAALEDLEQLCEDPDAPDEHCTVNVSGLNGTNGRRIDYLFVKRLGEVQSNRAVFNPRVDPEQPTVSDHAAVVTSIALPLMLTGQR